MKEKAPSETARQAVQKLSLSPRAQSPRSRGFDINLLANSLTSKLKQQKIDLRNAQKSLCQGGNRKGRRHTNGAVTKSILTRQDKGRSETQTKKDVPVAIQQGGGGGGDRGDNYKVEARPPPSRGSCTVPRRPRVDSAASDKVLARVTSGKNSLSSRRSSSAGGTSGHRSAMSITSETGALSTNSDLAFLRSHGSAASGSAFSFESRGGGRSVQVVKRDGVFQPLDKYAPGRHVLRETCVPARGGACEYEVYVLPLCEDSSIPQGTASPRGYYDEMARKSLKVSWSKIPHEGNDPNEEDIRQREHTSTPYTPQPYKRPVTEDIFAFRRPVYSSGKSRVSGIGVMWELPLPSEAPPAVKETSEKKPMWSWLVMHEDRQKTVAKNRGGGGASSGGLVRPFSTNPAPLTTATSSVDIRTQHSRDLHPVTTALDREGTSVSKTKWHVPSSSGSTLEAERSVMGRLELVKRPGSQLLYETSTQAFSFAPAMGSSNLPLKLKGSTEQIKAAIEEMEKPLEEQEETNESGGKSNTDRDSVYSDSRQGDEGSSPTKSRSTNN